MSDTVHNPPNRRLWAIAYVAHWLFAVIPLLYAIVSLAIMPGVERAVLLYFAPPVLACLFICADTGKFNSTIVRGCRVFLTTIAIAILFAQQDFILVGLKPVFPGLPVQANRILTFYFFAYFSFLLIICPIWFMAGIASAAGGRITFRFYLGIGCWLMVVGFVITGALNKLL